MRVRAPAKINLALLVGRLGDDGYHPLVNLFQAVSLLDDVLAAPAEPGCFTVTMTGESAGVGEGPDNLALRAARLLAEEHGGDEPLGVALTVRKTIPVAGGMAGGSADAAAALLACSVLWDLDVAPDQLAALGSRLGADVPFALLGGTALGTGRGDVLAPVLTSGTFHWVLAVAEEGLSTPAVYTRFDELGRGRRPEELDVPDELMNALRTGDARALAGQLHNDLAEAALDLRPDLSRTLERGRELGALASLVSGSGPTCAFLCEDESAAIDVSTQLASTPGVQAVRRVLGPVHGARLVSPTH
ncbi:4-(cytidine 5'-diphospho)-2-C-methyl-D-erythritol kinase [Auraticoccus sp. F435]|uniref:4-diphosphocytidyl-2-C-methyl-D-erythritol kinase n=1 Tax=Auraticoccus cholistanensis TaxID=2656650 RepID=A0A6A9UUZ6_9ACTN|nr:4-(cytidine 5'-diphospho)-2-C-methyl-D-erythritol kinase [Auraticoccus cholistanensis]